MKKITRKNLDKRALLVINRRANIREDFLNGIVSIDILAGRHGIARDTVSRYIKDIGQQLREEDKAIAEEQALISERRLLDVYSRANQSFNESRGDAVETTTTYTPIKCNRCEGSGMVDGDIWCDACDGNGVQISESVVRKVHKQAGDPRFLKVQVDCMREINRIKGNYPKKEPKPVENKNEQHLHLHQHGVDLSKVPDASLLKALELIDEWKEGQQAIEVESIPVSEEKTP